MKYDTTFINRNFLLKVYGVDSENRRINRLVGVSGLVGLIGVELTEKFITRAFKVAGGPYSETFEFDGNSFASHKQAIEYILNNIEK